MNARARHLSILILLIVIALTLTGCGVLDIDGSNARAEAQANADAEYERTKQTVIENATLRALDAEITERARAYYAYLASLQDNTANAAPPPTSAGLNHNGGIVAQVTAGIGVGWQILLVAIVGFLALLFLVSWLGSRGEGYPH